MPARRLRRTWLALPETSRRRLVSVVGGESTGKTTLANALAHELPAVAVPETLRNWVTRKGRVPRADEQIEVLREHRLAEVEALAQPAPPQWVVSDSGPIMTAAYSVIYYNDDSLVAEARRMADQVALVVWCDADIPWTPDGAQRDGPHMREAAQDVLGQILLDSGLPFLSVSGTLDQRVAQVRDRLGI